MATGLEYLAAGTPAEGLRHTLHPISSLKLHSLVFITNYQPNVIDVAAAANPDARVMLIGLKQYRSQVTAPNVDFVDLEPLIEATRNSGFDASYVYAAVSSPDWAMFTVRRWLVLSHHLRSLNLPPDAALACFDADVLLFEAVAERWQWLSKAQAASDGAWVMKSGFSLISPGAVHRFAAFIRHVYALPQPQMESLMWRYGTRARLPPTLPAKKRERLRPWLVRNETVTIFNDNEMVDAFRASSAKGELPAVMRARWTMGAVRPDCVPIKFARQFYQQDGASNIVWRGRVPHAPLPNGTLAQVCFIHYGGPLKNELMKTTIAKWRSAREGDGDG